MFFSCHFTIFNTDVCHLTDLTISYRKGKKLPDQCMQHHKWPIVRDFGIESAQSSSGLQY